MKLALGTAQFGLPYGVANTNGQISQDSARKILSYCKFKGIDVLDTAISYGESEKCLGSIGVKDFKIISKLPPIPDNVVDVKSWIMEQVDACMSRLNVKNLYGLMLHRPEQLFGRHGKLKVATLVMLKDMDIIQNVGVSVYSPAEFTKIFSVYDFDLVQCPFSLVDRRLVSSGWLKKLKSLGVEVHVRSSFLQGLLLMPRHKIPSQFQRWNSIWDYWHEWLEASAVSPIEACLGYVLSELDIHQIVVGVDSMAQLEQIVSTTEYSSLDIFPDISTIDDNLLNPSNWKVQ